MIWKESHCQDGVRRNSHGQLYYFLALSTLENETYQSFMCMKNKSGRKERSSLFLFLYLLAWKGRFKKETRWHERRKRPALREGHISFSDATNLYAKAGGKCVKKSTPRKNMLCKMDSVYDYASILVRIEEYCPFLFEILLNTSLVSIFIIMIQTTLCFFLWEPYLKIVRWLVDSLRFGIRGWYWRFILLMSDGKSFVTNQHDSLFDQVKRISD